MTEMNEWGLSQVPPVVTPPSTTTTSLVGAGVGAVVGAGIGHVMKGKHTVAGGAVGAAAGGAAGYYYGKGQQPAAIPPGPGGSPGIPAGQNGTFNPLPSGAMSVNISQQGGALTVTVDPTATLQTVSLGVPATGTTSSATYQVSASNAPAASSPSPVSGSLLTGTNTLTIGWTTAAGVSKTSAITVNVA